jgi:hypothetical protein
MKRKSALESMKPKENTREAREEITKKDKLIESKNRQTIRKEGNLCREDLKKRAKLEKK